MNSFRIFLAAAAVLLTGTACSKPEKPGTTDPGGNIGEPAETFIAAVTTLAADGITAQSAVLHASFSGVNTAKPPQNVVFEWGTSASLGETLGAQEVVTTASGTFSASLTGLTSKQTIWFRASMDAWNPEKNVYTTVTGETLQFVTEEVAQTTSGAPTWPELPALDYTHYTTDGNYYIDNATHNGHFPAGTLYYTHHWTDEKYAGTNTYYRNYTCCWSSERICPVWVAAPRHDWYEGSCSSRTYRFNPDMPKEVQYKKTSGSGDYNRGHMLGAKERSRKQSIYDQVNYITNIAPQHATYFNTGGGGWNILEDWVDTQVCSDTLYIVVGCWFEDYTDGYGNHAGPSTIPSYMGTTNVHCPTMQYYLLLRTKKGNTGKSVKDCTSSELQCAAFVRAHASGIKGQKVSAKEMKSIRYMEELTGFTFFPNVPSAPKDSFTASDWGL